jgi:hypothetical protein
MPSASNGMPSASKWQHFFVLICKKTQKPAFWRLAPIPVGQKKEFGHVHLKLIQKTGLLSITSKSTRIAIASPTYVHVFPFRSSHHISNFILIF